MTDRNDKPRETRPPETLGGLWLGILAHIVEAARKPPEEVTTPLDQAVAVAKEAPALALLCVGFGGLVGALDVLVRAVGGAG